MASHQDKKALFGGDRTNVTDWGDGGKPGPRQDALGNKIPEPEEEIKLIEKEMQELKMLFERYLTGAEKRSPTRRRDMLWERLRRLKNADIKMTTGLKFRLEQTYSKLAAYDRVWTRSLAEKEAGTYARDLFRMKRRASEAEVPAPPRPVAQPTRPSMLSDGQLRTLFNTYVMARERTNESTEGMTLEGLGRNLDKQVPLLLNQFGCTTVDFKVIIKNGKAMLKAVPRK